ncbi:hypothetical protein GGTG_04028 [Gaeumannomyces tritici R3-111a-1]|uniref:Uncharacterized protein n=1 Tax=Gaeumannomyces tritici (strain R3-111a-1) TaxID=644352 RepID=J3NRY0_GAET3|nr:hypothetical protein GGTG_04028 [Gaeumannomyces tritici R3-111a-1]EJT78936.1 hypothetical protein GGTG_04028 [Gaeumannomyces tritici R3-111a-1]
MNSSIVEAPKRTQLPSLWTGNYRDGSFPPDPSYTRLPSLSAGPMLASPMSPRAAPPSTPASFGNSPTVLHPRDTIGDSVNELSRSLIHSLNQGMGRRLSTADSTSSPASSPMSGVFDRMARGGSRAPSVYSANTSLLLSGVSQADVKSPVGRRKLTVAEQRHPGSILVTAVPLRRLSNGEMPVDESQPGRVIIAAGVIPRVKTRSRFEMKRSFDLGQVRKSIAGPPRRLSSAAAAGSLGGSDASGRRSSTMIRPSSQQNGVADAADALTNTRQINLTQASNCLPIIAALMISGHLRDEDRIELPMPHPEAWPNTFAYVAESQGELTDAVRKNILHLGGKV